MNIKRGKRIFQNIIVAKGLLLNTAGERGEEIVRVGVLNAGKQAGECVTARSVRMLIAFFELTGRAVWCVASLADNLPDSILNFLTCRTAPALVDYAGYSRNGNSGLSRNLFQCHLVFFLLFFLCLLFFLFSFSLFSFSSVCVFLYLHKFGKRSLFT